MKKRTNILLLISAAAFVGILSLAPLLHQDHNPAVDNPGCIACVVQHHTPAPSLSGVFSVTVFPKVQSVLKTMPEAVSVPLFPGFIFANKAPPSC